MENDSIQLASHEFGKGRGVYISGLPYSPENSHLFLRALFYAARKEEELYEWYSDNVSVELHYYPETKKYAVVNNFDEATQAKIYLEKGTEEIIDLEPGEIVWRDYSEQSN